MYLNVVSPLACPIIRWSTGSFTPDRAISAPNVCRKRWGLARELMGWTRRERNKLLNPAAVISLPRRVPCKTTN